MTARDLVKGLACRLGHQYQGCEGISSGSVQRSASRGSEGGWYPPPVHVPLGGVGKRQGVPAQGLHGGGLVGAGVDLDGHHGDLIRHRVTQEAAQLAHARVLSAVLQRNRGARQP